MTLIVCLKAQDCVVFAADSLTTVTKYDSGKTEALDCNTVKLHSITNRAVMGGCGMSRIQGEYWSSLITRFSPAAPNGDFVGLTGEFRTFVDEQLKCISNDPGARAGGNTFLLAGFEAGAGGMIVSKVTRTLVGKTCDVETIVSDASSPHYIEFIGDISPISEYLSQVEENYVPSMDRGDAENFAFNAIVNGITAARAQEIATIGGHTVVVATVDQNAVTISEHASGIACP